MALGIPDYVNLELSGEALAAAEQMENRAAQPASIGLFDTLVRPLLPGVNRVLEFGCGTGALAARIAWAAPGAEVIATDKSPTMLAAARALRTAENAPPITFAPWDLLDENLPVPGGQAGFDLILASVVTPYLPEPDLPRAFARLAGMLTPGGVLALLEQDLATVAMNIPDRALVEKSRTVPHYPGRSALGLALRPLLRDAGLEPLPRASYLWTDDSFCPYIERLMDRTAADLVASGVFQEAEGARWMRLWREQAARGEAYYGLVYHRVAARKP
jgi:SAM-dependent methyltransferase